MTGTFFRPAHIVIAAGVCAALHVGKMPPALPVLREALGVSLLQAGFLLSMVQLAGMTLGLAVGLAADGLGLKRSILAGLSLLAAASSLGTLARTAEAMLLLRALEGFGILLATLPAPGLIRQLVAPAELSAKMGLWSAYMPLGTALGLLCGPLALVALGWQGWWGLLAVLTACMVAWLAVAVPSDGQRRLASAAPPGAMPSTNAWPRRLRQTLSARGPQLVALCFAVYSGQWLAVIGFLPSIYAQAGLGGAVLGLLTALAAAVNMVGNIAAGRLLQRGVPAQTLLYGGFSAMALGAWLAFGLEAAPPWLRYVGVLLFSALGGMVPGTLFALAVRLAPSEATVSTTVGWMQQCSALGQFTGPPLVAWVAAWAMGWQWTWVVTGAGCLVGVVVAVQIARLPNTLPKA